MRPTRKSTRERGISIMALLVVGIGFLVPKAAAQSDEYSTMAPVARVGMAVICLDCAQHVFVDEHSQLLCEPWSSSLRSVSQPMP